MTRVSKAYASFFSMAGSAFFSIAGTIVLVVGLSKSYSAMSVVTLSAFLIIASVVVAAVRFNRIVSFLISSVPVTVTSWIVVWIEGDAFRLIAGFIVTVPMIGISGITVFVTHYFKNRRNYPARH